MQNTLVINLKRKIEEEVGHVLKLDKAKKTKNDFWNTFKCKTAYF